MSTASAPSNATNAWPSKLRRIRALVTKEGRQIVRDPSSIAIGVVLPLILILLFGYGLSLDVKNVPLAVVIEYPTPEAVELAAGFQLSPYFHPWMMRSMPPSMRFCKRIWANRSHTGCGASGWSASPIDVAGSAIWRAPPMSATRCSSVIDSKRD